VLLARIRAHLRQHEHSEDAVFAIGPFSFEPASKMLLSEKGSKIHLTEKETLMLKHLYRAAGKPVTRKRPRTRSLPPSIEAQPGPALGAKTVQLRL
jgi:DNA-binding response OmpR family regulator